MIKIARVLSNKDPKAQERLKVSVLGYHNIYQTDDSEVGVWADHCSPYKFSTGSLPVHGDMVYVWFDTNTPSNVIWFGLVVSSFVVDDNSLKETIKTDTELINTHTSI